MRKQVGRFVRAIRIEAYAGKGWNEGVVSSPAQSPVPSPQLAVPTALHIEISYAENEHVYADYRLRLAPFTRDVLAKAMQQITTPVVSDCLLFFELFVRYG